MKRLFVSAILVLAVVSGSFAGGYLTLGGDSAFLTNNYLFGSGASTVTYFNGAIGMTFDSGFIAGLRYDHIGIEDQSYSSVTGSTNARFVGAVPGLELGYFLKCMDNKLLWWSTARFSYAMSARYRRDVFNYKGTAFVPAVSTALYYQLKNQFYAGLEVGYRYFTVKYAAPINNELNLGGMFVGISLIHLFNEQAK
jgi:hypothetical protein